MRRIFLDTNIVIDLLCEREPWFDDVAKVFDLGAKGKVELYCSSLTFATASYIMERKKMSAEDIFNDLRILCNLCTPACVDAGVIGSALKSSFRDFEDALQCYSAQTVSADCIVTRNKKDFAYSAIPVYDLYEFLDLINN